jgi:hypothetical protein
MAVTDHGIYQNWFSATEIHTFSKGLIYGIFTRPLTPLSYIPFILPFLYRQSAYQGFLD